MRLIVNDEGREVAARTLAAALVELGYEGSWLATAVNGEFVPRAARADRKLGAGDAITCFAPIVGG